MGFQLTLKQQGPEGRMVPKGAYGWFPALFSEAEKHQIALCFCCLLPPGCLLFPCLFAFWFLALAAELLVAECLFGRAPPSCQQGQADIAENQVA